jgi:cation:H+ antiporter
MGFAFVAVATSLPEASATFGAVRRRAYTLAISGILGTNILNVGLLFGVDFIARGPPVLNDAGRFGAIAALLGAAVTALFLAGLAERRDRTIFRMGYDSLAVLATYLAGLGFLYVLRSEA